MDADKEWKYALSRAMTAGALVQPRGLKTRELLHHTSIVDLTHPVVTHPLRKLQPRFMAAEAYWILSGDNTEAGIAPYNGMIEQYSDDGKVFAGAYGPRIQAQLDYVIRTLERDPDSRQATLTIWTPNPTPSKDIPCTVAFNFQLRDGCLHVHAFMRSSDIWLGLPYDIFNFCMLGFLLCSKLSMRPKPGRLYLTAASSHIYEQHWEAAMACLNYGYGDQDHRKPVPQEMYESGENLLSRLRFLRETAPGDRLRWWEK